MGSVLACASALRGARLQFGLGDLPVAVDVDLVKERVRLLG